MAIKTYKPYTPSRRYITDVSSGDITAESSVRSLLIKPPAHTGRSSYGHIASRHKEAGARELYRIINFKRRKSGVEGKVEAIEYDPYENCRITLISYKDGEKRYILQPRSLKVGDVIMTAESELDIRPDNAVKLKNIPVGAIAHNVELKPGRGGQIIRSAGAYAQLMGKEEKYATLRFAGGEMRQILAKCVVSIGKVDNEEWANITIGRAGRNRHRGIHPQTRGSAMNPVGHPYGSGEGKKSSGHHPIAP